MNSTFCYDVVNRASNFKRRIELKQRLRPEFAFGQLGFYYFLDLWVGDLEKTADVVLVV